MAKKKIATAYVQVCPSMDGVAAEVRNQFSSAGNSSGSAFGSNLVGTIKNVIAAAGIGKALKESITAGADLQQSLGGIETLFKDSAATVIANAKEAYKTAGMSANGYMEQVTSFSASLLQSLSGDTAKAAAVADMAMTDMSDNANKMGTDMERITDAYQGFAKQNYTMLDNLKLGYGGTKTEMERLLADAEKLTGVKYDINNLSDVYSAIHVVQEELGITGTTALEASSTLTGSFNAMKAAATNVLGNLALGKSIEPSLKALVETTSTFLLDNLMPMVRNIVSTLPGVFTGALDIIGAELTNRIPGLSFIFENLETVVISLTAAMVAYKAASAISGVLDALRAATEGQTIAQTLLNAVMNANPFVLVATLIAGLVAAIVTLWNTNEGFRNAVTSAWKSVKSAVASVVDALVGFFTGTVPNAINTLVTGITSIPGKISSIFKSFSWGSIGSNVISGIAKGITSGVSSIISAAKQAAQYALTAAKKALGIASPSKRFRDEVGKQVPAGIAMGIQDNAKQVYDAVDDISENMLYSSLRIGNAKVPMSGAAAGYGNVVNLVQNIYSEAKTAADLMQEARYQQELAVMFGV